MSRIASLPKCRHPQLTGTKKILKTIAKTLLGDSNPLPSLPYALREVKSW